VCAYMRGPVVAISVLRVMYDRRYALFEQKYSCFRFYIVYDGRDALLVYSCFLYFMLCTMAEVRFVCAYMRGPVVAISVLRVMYDGRYALFEQEYSCFRFYLVYDGRDALLVYSCFSSYVVYDGRGAFFVYIQRGMFMLRICLFIGAGLVSKSAHSNHHFISSGTHAAL
jgi:hypothetical protein